MAKVIVVMGDEERENEGEFIIPAVGCSTDQMVWMIKHTRYRLTPTPSSPIHLLFAPPHNAFKFSLPMMVPQNEDQHRTAYIVTVDHKLPSLLVPLRVSS